MKNSILHQIYARYGKNVIKFFSFFIYTLIERNGRYIFMINLSLLYCWNRYRNMGCVFWLSDYNWINMRESIILLVAIAIFIIHLPILYFWFNQFHLQYFDCCVQHAALFRETYSIINTIINSQPTNE